MTIRFSLFAATTAALLTAGCGNKAPAGQVVAQGGGAVVTKGADGSTTVTSNQGTATITTGAAAAMPGGLPAYPGAQTTGGVNVTGNTPGGSGSMVTFTTTDTPAQVMDFYANAGNAAGMQTAQRANAGDTQMLSFQHGNETISVTATLSEGKTQVLLGSSSN